MDRHDLSIVVVGSVNLDIVARVQRFPVPGETLNDAIVDRFPGGKGANQALAASRLGARVSMLACVGDDPVADEALATLKSEGVDLSGCHRLKGINTGTALILVNAEGENQIVVAPGANGVFTPDLLELPMADAVISQLEVPMETVLAAARQTKGLFCLNAAPAMAVPHELLEHTDLLIVNEHEAGALGSLLSGFKGLLATTYGSRGATVSREGTEIASARPTKVKVIDTTGAGDAFTAALALALALADKRPIEEALEYACRVGALTTTGLGAQSSPRAQRLVRDGDQWIEDTS